MAVLQCADIPVSQLSGLVAEVMWSADTLLLAFRTADWKFAPFSIADASWLDETSEGRIFSPSGELRWRLINDQFRLVYMGEDSVMNGLEDCSQELGNLTPSIKEFLFWGVRSDLEQEWLEQQVPQRFSYPIYGGQIERGRIQLLVEQHCDYSGIPRFSRYHSIKEVSGGSHAS